MRSIRFFRPVATVAITAILAAASAHHLLAEDLPPAEDADPAEVAIGERLFLETRFAQFFLANSGDDVNAALPVGDPVMDQTVTPAGNLPGPFAGASMNCRACHLVDEHAATPRGGNRTYADFARRSPLPAREDGRTVTARNSPPLVNATLPRRSFLLHFDGEFATLEDLVRETLVGRNFGWLPSERAQALAHVAQVIRNDDGRGALAQEFGGAYPVVLKGIDPAIPPQFRLPTRLRIDVTRASDAKIVNAVSKLVAAYVTSLLFIQDDRGDFDGSPYDAFLRKNGLPRRPGAGESDLVYSRRLRGLLEALRQPKLVGAKGGAFRLHRQSFRFGPRELIGVKVFLREPSALPLDSSSLKRGGIGNCIVCHPAPAFTDFGLHNTGAAQSEYDAIHGPGAFAALQFPDLATRNSAFDAWLPPTPTHPRARGPLLAVPSLARPGETDLGVWNVFGNPDHPRTQASLRRLLCDGGAGCQPAGLLDRAVARFKTPGLRDLGHSGPYLHTGRADTLEEVLGLYEKFSGLARAGRMRNPAPELVGLALTRSDVSALAAFLRALNEDYE